jgi:hypothetical protein
MTGGGVRNLHIDDGGCVYTHTPRKAPASVLVEVLQLCVDHRSEEFLLFGNTL